MVGWTDGHTLDTLVSSHHAKDKLNSKAAVWTEMGEKHLTTPVKDVESVMCANVVSDESKIDGLTVEPYEKRPGAVF